MTNLDLAKKFHEISVETPVDKIGRQIRMLISSGLLNPGDRLPSERKLAERLGVGRGNVRNAIRKLEFYGILKTHPQSGTIVAGIGITALEGLISDVLKLENSDFASLVETRVLLEIQATKLAAKRRSKQDLIEIKKALEAYEQKVQEGSQALEEDLIFHLAIADASKNTVLKSLMLIITPDIINSFIQLDVCKDDGYIRAMEEHRIILKHITNQEPEAATQAMQKHLKEVKEYSQSLKEK